MNGHRLTLTVNFDETDDAAVLTLVRRAKELDTKNRGEALPEEHYTVPRCLAIITNLDNGLAGLFDLFGRHGAFGGWVAAPHIRNLATLGATDYLALPAPERDDVRSAAHATAARADARYAALLTAEAGLAAQGVFPDADRLVFALTDDLAGASVSLVAAYAATATCSKSS
jgi:hypothetical protein